MKDLSGDLAYISDESLDKTPFAESFKGKTADYYHLISIEEGLNAFRTAIMTKAVVAAEEVIKTRPGNYPRFLMKTNKIGNALSLSIDLDSMTEWTTRTSRHKIKKFKGSTSHACIKFNFQDENPKNNVIK